MKDEQIHLELKDSEWPCDYIDHDRQIVRAIVIDEEGYFYFVRISRDDEFGKATLIETSGGGVEAGEDPVDAIHRELKEELGVSVDVVCELGVVSDYYNLIHRHNLNRYFLCKIKNFGHTDMTDAEINSFHLSTLRMSYQEALEEYERCTQAKLGRLIAQRELPILHYAEEVLQNNR